MLLLDKLSDTLTRRYDLAGDFVEFEALIYNVCGETDELDDIGYQAQGRQRVEHCCVALWEGCSRVICRYMHETESKSEMHPCLTVDLESKAVVRLCHEAREKTDRLAKVDV